MRGDLTAHKLRSRWWPIWLFVIFALLCNFLFPPLIGWLDFLSFEQEIQALVFFAGVVVGECCFIVLVSGFTKRTWLGAYLCGLGIAAAGYVAALCGFWLIDELNQESIAMVALLPAHLLAAISPLCLLRHSFGWRLVYQDEVPAPRQPLQLADIFSLTAIVAASLVLVRVPQVISETPAVNYWPGVATACLILFGISLVVVPLHARVVLRDRPLATTLGWLMLLAIMIVVICFGIAQLFFFPFHAAWNRRLEFLPFLLTFLGAAIGVFYISLSLLSASGLRLVRGRGSKQGHGAEGNQQQAAHLKRLTWWRIGGAIAVTMVASMYLANVEQWRAFRDKENAILTRRAKATGSALGIIDRVPSNLRLGAKATDADFAAFARCNELEHLYLVKARVTDLGLENLQHFPLLKTLHLENMSVSDDGLVRLRHLPNLETLKIVNCDVKGTHLVGLPDKRRLTTLALIGTQFGDDECELLVGFSNLESLTLNRTCITDHSFEAIGRLKALTHLKLAGTEIEAARFPFFPSLRHLDLSRTRVDDQAVLSIARLSQLQFLSLRNTKVSNISIPSLASLEHLYHLDLSDNPIDDEGIREFGRDASLLSVDLSCTRVTGSGFVDWHSNYHDIILDRTLIDDQGVAALISIGEVNELSLAKTAITDTCLGHLAQIAISELDIRGTQITFNGLVTNGLPSVRTLHVAAGQFTPQQISQLKQQLKITVTIGKP